ncbi:cell shape-determining protein MreC precursor [Clostridium acetireducens DSM 10703]|jgi:rod shape-determining protein MreC|uniref:Cell shape-determining protein MreC n=1 Tax=Clostridium acetireducens DSM 10703 TaxID=1121290 RepID=A0A1E8F238_9CLOT|nr:rod shape-determining protein MreC [Clostridium acetireducens]OFI07229.1 cell shape-determining protein MreC precursor [Clostridium acetireducens DSM 10703]
MKILKNKLAVAVVVLSVTFLILIAHSVKREKMGFVQNGVGIALNPIQRVVYSLNDKVNNSITFILNFSKVKNENEVLIKRNIDLEKKLVEYDTLKSENERLRSMLDFKSKNTQYDYVGCNIIGKSGGNFLDEFTIDRGTDDGIKKQMVAVTAEGLVGQVTAVGTNWAIVQSLSNENLAVSGMLHKAEDNIGIVRGYKDTDRKQLAKLYYLPLDSKIKKDDIVLTAGLGESYPKGIRIGSVIDIEEDKGKVMKNAIIKPYVDFGKIQELFIIVPKNKIDVKY